MELRDDQLLGRLRQLSLVDVDSLLAGASGTRYGELVAAYADDVGDALACARARIRELGKLAMSGADPLGLIEVAPPARAREAAAAAGDRASDQLRARAEACRALASLNDAAALLLPRLIEADRRRTG
jgi:hypothetical protein